MECVLREMVEKDKSFLFELYVSTRRQEVESWGWTSEQMDVFLKLQWQTQQFSYSQQFPGANHSIILYENECAGRCIIENTSEYVHLIDISLLPGYQGKGIGTFIIEKLQQQAIQENKAVILQVLHSNPARLLYERLGFQMVEANGLYNRMQWQQTI